MVRLKSRVGSAASTPVEPDQSFLGLASRRRRKAVSLEDIANTTKIGVRALQAIESGEFQKLPGGIYTTSYIRQYARAIDFDEEALLSQYYAKMGIPSSLGLQRQASRESDGNLITRLLRYPA